MKELLIPVFCMMGLHMVVMPMSGIYRVYLVMAGRFSIRKFRYVELQDGPDFLRQSSRHFDNLFQVPLLFFSLVAFTLISQAHLQEDIFISLAWTYFILRLGHTLVHLTINLVPLRAALFISSNVVLIVYFVNLLKVIF